jgi:hypothetical protein
MPSLLYGFRGDRCGVVRLGGNEGAILWTPLLTPFASTDTLAPKGPGCLQSEDWVEWILRGDLLGFISMPSFLWVQGGPMLCGVVRRQ